MASVGATSMRALTMEFKALEREPVEGFLVTIPDESDFYSWQVAIFGPPETPYEGGYFKVCIYTVQSVSIEYNECDLKSVPGCSLYALYC